jgi:hypothetical protein
MLGGPVLPLLVRHLPICLSISLMVTHTDSAILLCTLVICCVIGGSIPLAMGIIDYIKLEGINAATTCTVRSTEIRSERCCDPCGKNCCTPYTCYRGLVTADCCGFCSVCLPGQIIDLGTARSSGEMSHILTSQWYPGAHFDCLNRPSDGTIATYSEWSTAVGEIIPGVVLCGLALLCFIPGAIVYCRSHFLGCFHYDQHDVELKVRNPKVISWDLANDLLSVPQITDQSASQ